MQPELADVTPWVMNSADAFRAPPPPGIDTPEYATAYNEVKALGAANSATRTADQTASAQFWAGAMGPGPWMQAALDVSANLGRSTLDNARLFALLETGVADAVITAWDNKYLYDFWRPVTAIRAGDTDGNAATEADALWSPLIFTPPHPSYFSAHAIIGGVASSVLADILGDDIGFCLSSGPFNRCFDNFSMAAQDSANSRLWGGIHWRFDNEIGLATGRALGLAALSGPAFDVPEPAAIALFGLGGAVLLARRLKRARSRGHGNRPASE